MTNSFTTLTLTEKWLILDFSPDSGLMAGGSLVVARGRDVASFATLPRLCRVVCGLLYYALQACNHRLSITKMSDSGATFISLVALSDQASSPSVKSTLRILNAFRGMKVTTVLFLPSECWDSLVRSVSFCVTAQAQSTTDPGLVLPVPYFIRDFVPDMNCVMVPMVPSISAGSSASLVFQTVSTQAVVTPLVPAVEGVSALPTLGGASGVASSTSTRPSQLVAPSGLTAAALVPVTVAEANVLPSIQLYSPISSVSMSPSNSDPDSDANSDSSLSLPSSIPIGSPRRSSTPLSVDTTEVYGEGDSIQDTPSPLMSPWTLGALSELVLILPIPASNAAQLLTEEVGAVSPDPVLSSVQAASPPFGSGLSEKDPLMGPSVMDDIPGMDLSLDSTPLAGCCRVLPRCGWNE